MLGKIVALIFLAFGATAITAAALSPQNDKRFCFFDHGSDQVKYPCQRFLRELLVNANGYSDAGDQNWFVVEGHAERPERGPFEHQLAWRRAVSVARILQSMNVPLGNVIIDEYGAEQPLVVELNTASEYQNRYVKVSLCFRDHLPTCSKFP